MIQNKTTETEREKVYAKMESLLLNNLINFKYSALDPVLLSNEQLANVRNLNIISHDTAIALIQSALDEGNNITEVYIDTVGPPDKYKRKLEG